MNIEAGGKIYFLGIGGTGMASVAGICQAAGYQLSGSDVGIYPPMSTMLEELNIPVFTPYSEANIRKTAPHLVVVANSLSRGNPEIEYVLKNQIPYTSFPALLGDLFLQNRQSIVVSGTHGKTTTTSLIAHVLNELGEDPSFFIGGIPRNFPLSFRLTQSPFFVIEGDEYDTAFFDKGPKFLHYCPKFLILNNIEFDHADIYPNVEAIERQFEKLAQLVPTPAHIIANFTDPRVRNVLSRVGLLTKVTGIGDEHIKDGSLKILSAGPANSAAGDWDAVIATPLWGELTIRTSLSGFHNILNIAHALGCLCAISNAKVLRQSVEKDALLAAIRSFRGVKRRLELLAAANGIEIYEDFAHHPTAIKAVIKGFRASHKAKRIIVAFEPRSATNRRNVFQEELGETLSLADLVLIGKSPVDMRIPVEQRMNTAALAAAIGAKATAYSENEDLFAALSSLLQSGDAVIFMSSGSFSGVQHQLADRVQDGSLRKT